MKTETTNWKVWQKASVATGFSETRRGGILGAEQQFDTLRALVRQVHGTGLTVLDVGCGDGIILEILMKSIAVANAVALDGSPAMLEKAQIRFEELGLFAGLVEYVESDFNEPGWVNQLPFQTYDVITSGFAIHHCEDDRKKSLYLQIFNLLKPGGLFVNIEHIASATPLGEFLFERAYAETVAKFRQSRGQETNAEEVYQELLIRPDKNANRLSPVSTQLDWLNEIGFVNVDCYWKHYELAVLAGFRPAG